MQVKAKSRKSDYAIVCLDYAQLELRVGTLFHQDSVMRKVLCDPKGDLHQKTADEFSVPRDPISKNINFLFQFGGGAYALAELMTGQGIPMTKTETQALVERYDVVYKHVRPWRESLLEEHQRNGFIRLFTGRKRRLIPEPDWADRYALHKAETTLANNAVQGCLSCDTKLLTQHGLLPIKELRQTTKVSKVGKRIWTGASWGRVTRVFSVGKKPLWEVCLSDGSTFQTSDTHLWKNEVNEWVETCNLRNGDYIQQSLVQVPKNLALNFQVAEAEFVGFMLGDGAYSNGDIRLVKKKELGISNHETQILNYLFTPSGWTLQGGAPSKYFYIRQQFCSRIRDTLGLGWGKRSFEKSVPLWLFTASLAHRKAFIRGYYLTDGGTSVREVVFTSVSEQLLRGVQTILYSLGIRARLKRYARCNPNERDYWRLRLAPEGKRKLLSIVESVPCAKVERLRKVSSESLTNKGDPIPPRLAKLIATDWQKSFEWIKSPSPEYSRRQAMFQKLKKGTGSLDFARNLPLSPNLKALVTHNFLRVISVTDCRKKVEMFDLTVEPSHQYAAWNGAIMHNSGQDFLKAAVVRSDPQCILPDEVFLRNFSVDKRHASYLRESIPFIRKAREVFIKTETQFLLQIHDEAIWRTKWTSRVEVLHLLAKLMCMRHFFPSIRPYCVPLVVEGGVSDNWKAAKSKECPDRVKYGFENGYDKI